MIVVVRVVRVLRVLRVLRALWVGAVGVVVDGWVVVRGCGWRWRRSR